MTEQDLFALRLNKALQENPDTQQCWTGTNFCMGMTLQGLRDAGFNDSDLLRAASVLSAKLMSAAAEALLMFQEDSGAGP